MPQMTELDPQRFVMPVSAREADEVRIRDQDSGAFIPAPWEQGTVLREAESGPLLSIGIRTGWMARGASGHWLHSAMLTSAGDVPVTTIPAGPDWPQRENSLLLAPLVLPKRVRYDIMQLQCYIRAVCCNCSVALLSPFYRNRPAESGVVGTTSIDLSSGVTRSVSPSPSPLPKTHHSSRLSSIPNAVNTVNGNTILLARCIAATYDSLGTTRLKSEVERR